MKNKSMNGGYFDGNYHCAGCGKVYRIAQQKEFLEHQKSCFPIEKKMPNKTDELRNKLECVICGVNPCRNHKQQLNQRVSFGEGLECQSQLDAADRVLAHLAPIRAAEIAALEKRIADIKADRITYCAYCGEEFPIDAGGTPDEVSKHIRTCEKHPMHDALATISALYEALKVIKKCIEDSETIPVVEQQILAGKCFLAMYEVEKQ